MANLLLSPTRKYFRFGDKDDYCVLDGGRIIGRIMLIRKDRWDRRGFGLLRRMKSCRQFIIRVMRLRAKKRW